jgi:hypothetical protein
MTDSQIRAAQQQVVLNRYAQQGYINSPNSYHGSPNSLAPQAVLVRLSDEDVQRIVQGVLDGMQERWGRRSDDD